MSTAETRRISALQTLNAKTFDVDAQPRHKSQEPKIPGRSSGASTLHGEPGVEVFAGSSGQEAYDV
jgi:hypothetical protein